MTLAGMYSSYGRDRSNEGIILPPCLGDSYIRPPCGPQLDFTRRELYFSILPASVAILWGLLRAWEVWKRPVVTQGSRPVVFKLVGLTRHLCCADGD